MKKIYVVIVTYNGRKWYDNCFGSLRYSTIPIQTIVIDNASTDDTISYIKENYPEIHLIESDKNLGFGKANNIGMKYALEQEADYVYLLNQDAWIDPSAFEKLILCHQNHPEYGILSPMQVTAKGDKLDKNFSLRCNSRDCPNLVDDLYFGTLREVYEIDRIMAAHWLISRECLIKVGGFAPLFSHYGEDDNFSDRATFHHFKTGIVPKVKAVHDREFREASFNKDIYLSFTSFLVNACNINKNTFRALCFAKLLLIYNITMQTIKHRTLLGFKYIFKSCVLIPNIISTRQKTKNQEGAYLINQ